MKAILPRVTHIDSFWQTHERSGSDEIRTEGDERTERRTERIEMTGMKDTTWCLLMVINPDLLCILEPNTVLVLCCNWTYSFPVVCPTLTLRKQTVHGWGALSVTKKQQKKTSPATKFSTTVACHTDIQHINLATQKNSAHWYAGLSKVKLNKDSNRHTYVSNTGP